MSNCDFTLTENFLIAGIKSELRSSPKDYSIRIKDKNLSEGLHKNLLAENDAGIVLCYKGLDSALISFNSSQYTLSCTQIQGGRDRYRELVSINWSTYLLRCAERYAKSTGYELITSLSADPRYTRINGWDFTNSSRLIKRYDSSARELGFDFNEEKGLYEKFF